MNKFFSALFVSCFLLCCSAGYAESLTVDAGELKPVAGESKAMGEQKTPWWEIATGILAIPVAIIAIPYSFLVLKKTRLESKKMELEIYEKEAQLAEVRAAHTDEVRQAIQPLIESRLIQLLFLRALVLYLILSAWGAVEDGFDLVFDATVAGIMSLFHIPDNSMWLIIPAVAIQKLPNIIHWVIFFAIGWPLFKDANKLVGINIKDIFKFRK
jgi:hypothetical protein